MADFVRCVIAVCQSLGVWVTQNDLISKNEIIRIPVIDYLAILVLAGLFWLGLWLARVVRSWRSPDVEIPRV